VTQVPVLSTAPPIVPAPRPGFRERRRRRHELGEHDRQAALLAELHLLRLLLSEAGELVNAGWVQHRWFTVRDEAGIEHGVGPRNLADLDGRQVIGTCLVGAIVHAGGGVEAAGSAAVHRAIDLTWATLHNTRVQWTPPPSIRLTRVHELVRWNDAHGRTADEVAGLLGTAAQRV
jgi:hypothetical protein